MNEADPSFIAIACEYLRPAVSARRVGELANAAGLKALDLAQLHEQTLVAKVLPGVPSSERAALTRQAADHCLGFAILMSRESLQAGNRDQLNHATSLYCHD